MKKRKLIKVDLGWIIPLLLAVTAILLFVLSLDERREEGVVTRRLNEIDELNRIQVKLNTSILKSRLFYLNHFDSIVLDQKKMHEVSTRLLEMGDDPDIGNLYALLLEKNNLIEQFKTSISVFKNSEQYIGVIIGEFINLSDLPSDPGFLTGFAQFHNTLSSFLSKPSAEKQKFLISLIQGIEQRGQDLPDQPRLILDQIIAHSKLLITQAEKIDGQVIRIIHRDQDNLLDTIHQSLLQDQYRIKTSLKKYEVTLYVIIVTLTLYTFFILVKLKLSNDLLEHRVRERTRELRKASRRAIEADAAKSAFLAHMSHEIRTPLNGVIGMTSSLLKKDWDAQEKEMVHAINYCGQSLLNLINDILDFSKIEANKLKLDVRPLNLIEVINESMAIVSINARKENVVLLKEISPNIPPSIDGDKNRISQILLNFLSNAIKFSKNGKVVVKLEALSQSGQEFQLALSVIDNGIGIAPNQLKNLFQEFSQADQSISSNFGGTGLGLSISKKLAELMGGKISVQSQYGVGSTFCFTFTAARSASDGIQATLCEQRERLSGVHPHKILIVDDNFINRKVARDLLKDLGYNPDLATDGHQALELIQKNCYDIVFTDLRMPSMDGYELVQRVKANPGQSIRFVAMTASATLDEKEKCLSHGISSFISKPIKEQDLVQVLSDRLEV